MILKTVSVIIIFWLLFPLQCLVLFALTERVLSSTVQVRTKPTDTWTDPYTRENLLCEMCGPGTVVLTRCTATHGGVISGTFNISNINFEEVSRPRNTTHSFSPEMLSVLLSYSSFLCLTDPMDLCFPGTHYRDSTCEICPRGYFSPTLSSTDRCIAHTNCTDGLVVNVPGNLYHDTLCTSCSTYVGITACDDALIQFLAHQKIAKRKLKTFIRSLVTTENVEQLHAEMSNGNRDMMYTKLYPLLVKWRASVNRTHVAEMIISKLESAKLKNVVTRIKNRFW
ncbi:tumor necrosis factor receptor superfamily member 6B-like [Leucoraja erinacea]|uniref:tumor necrosis factor receptor superfamily member 6B-like n=1 Tax=Leucoraja erinaceus TaxID=7782 RepID=UPI0024540924|nr:tumor necrosis factor receptor superfamily member 6B-like [Leucoraja erinacea]